MTMRRPIVFLLFLILLSSFIYADFRPQENIVGMNYSNITGFVKINATYIYQDGNLVLDTTSNTTVLDMVNESSLNLSNSFDYPINETVLNQDSGFLSVVKSWWDGLYCQLTGCTMTGNLTTSGNITADYYYGQPMDGSIGCGIIYSSSNEFHCGCINVSDEGGLDVKYPDLIVRLVDIDNTVTYCTLNTSTITVDDNTHDVFYLNSDCELKNMTFNSYFGQDINPPNYCRVFDVKTYNNDIEVLKGKTLMNLNQRKSRWLNVQTDHLTRLTGMSIVEDTFPYFNLTSGTYEYINSIVTSQARNSENNGSHLIGYNGGVVTHYSQTGINLTDCTDGTNTATCSNNLYRRYLVGVEGWGDNTYIHQFAPHTSDDTFPNIGGCTDLIANPLEFNYLADSEKWAFVKLYAYCGKRDDATWAGEWIKINGNGAGLSGAIDTSHFLRDDGTVALIANYDQGAFNFTNPQAWFLGLINASSVQNPPWLLDSGDTGTGTYYFNGLRIIGGDAANTIYMSTVSQNMGFVTNGGNVLIGRSGAPDLLITDNGIEVTGAITGDTLDTGQGINELYFMNQDVGTGNATNFITVNTGQGDNELYAMNQDVESSDAVAFTTVNTGQGAYELYAMNQDVESTDAVSFITLNTGQGANELYDMNQNVQTTDDVTFNNITVTENIKVENITGVVCITFSTGGTWGDC